MTVWDSKICTLFFNRNFTRHNISWMHSAFKLLSLLYSILYLFIVQTEDHFIKIFFGQIFRLLWVGILGKLLARDDMFDVVSLSYLWTIQMSFSCWYIYNVKWMLRKDTASTDMRFSHLIKSFFLPNFHRCALVHAHL